MFHIVERQPTNVGTQQGAAAGFPNRWVGTPGAWPAVFFNKVTENDILGASLASDGVTFTLGPGKYSIHTWTHFYHPAADGQLRLRDIIHNINLTVEPGSLVTSRQNVTEKVEIEDEFTLTQITQFQIQFTSDYFAYCTASMNSGEDMIYAQCLIHLL